MQATPVTRTLDGAVLIFQRYDDLWMIDRVDDAANDCEAYDDDGDATEAPSGASTAVGGDELRGLSELEQWRYVRRHLRRLGLPERGVAARVIGAMVRDFESFTP